ncbi:unknown [Crocosphaera subtropica ATCC 51142]|uniref:Glutaredoxin 2 n=1 Tax=Crocosphaera subtropica (strain ATCC 51142 / BH68) TaxID=43989 RepID=B1WRA1_CROS5|nr:glutaredoxin family protein [Crocosphaera subtropica]ACB51750.1 unknown [Crocosphaera subtropica ATCC 51142]
MRLILYSKPGCHLCEGLEGKLKQIETLPFELEIRDITTRDDWFTAYQYEIPVLRLQLPKGEKTIPRFSPRISVDKLAQKLEQYFQVSDGD